MANDHLKRKRILLVDDEPELLVMVVSILQEEGYLQIKTAKNAVEALNACREWSPELGISMLCCRMEMVSPCFKRSGSFLTFPSFF